MQRCLWARVHRIWAGEGNILNAQHISLSQMGEACRRVQVVVMFAKRCILKIQESLFCTSQSSACKPLCREVGDGNINFVYIVEGPAGAICIKQALPFVRIVGESWPLTQVGRVGSWMGS